MATGSGAASQSGSGAAKKQMKVKYNKIQLKDLEFFKGDNFFERGQFGDVKRAKWNNKEVAVKCFTSQDRKGGFSEELINLSQLQDHERIVKMHGACVSDHPFIVLEFAPLSLEKVIHEGKKEYRYTSDHVISWAYQSAVGLNHVHNKGLLHRDVKPSNILLFERGKILKLCDFGTAKKLEHTLTNAVGTIRYMAPEVIRGRYYTDRCDVFSFGIMVWEMLARRRPTLLGAKGNNMAILYAMANGARPPKISNLPKVMAEMIDRCWDEEPQNRPTMTEIELKLNYLCQFIEKGKPLIIRRQVQKSTGPKIEEAVPAKQVSEAKREESQQATLVPEEQQRRKPPSLGGQLVSGIQSSPSPSGSTLLSSNLSTMKIEDSSPQHNPSDLSPMSRIRTSTDSHVEIQPIKQPNSFSKQVSTPTGTSESISNIHPRLGPSSSSTLPRSKWHGQAGYPGDTSTGGEGEGGVNRYNTLGHGRKPPLYENYSPSQVHPRPPQVPPHHPQTSSQVPPHHPQTSSHPPQVPPHHPQTSHPPPHRSQTTHLPHHHYFQSRFLRAGHSSPYYIRGLNPDLQPILPIDTNRESMEIYEQFKRIANEVTGMMNEHDQLKEEVSKLETEIQGDQEKLGINEGIQRDYLEKKSDKEKLMKELKRLQDKYDELRKENSEVRS